MKHTYLEKKILLSRFLTRSGDQAWDFALPLTLVGLFKNRLDIVATVYLISKLIGVLLQPAVARIVDRAARLQAAVVGTCLQVGGLLLETSFVAGTKDELSSITFSPLFLCLLSAIILGNVAASLGSGLMEIAVGNDWVPKLLVPERLTFFNSRLRQLDLATEVGSPIVAGVILLLGSQADPLMGFYAIAAWNVISFLPEILLLRSVFFASTELQKSVVVQPEIAKKNIVTRLFEGWAEFRNQECMPAMVAYAFLWLSALSPHGVLLTAFLKGGWQMPESALGLFRGLGAVFGLFSTLLFPFVTKRLGLLNSTRAFILFQALMVLGSLIFFVVPVGGGGLFLTFILFSRIGLYGFSLGEMEIRQRMIPEGVRGVVNGAANSLTGLATVALFCFGSVFSTPERFVTLVLVSVASVTIGALLYSTWASRKRIREQTI